MQQDRAYSPHIPEVPHDVMQYTPVSWERALGRVVRPQDTPSFSIGATRPVALATEFTVFYSHPVHGAGHYTVSSTSAQTAGENASQELPEDMSDDEEPEGIDIDIIRDDLDIRVYAGRLDAEPAGQAPDWVFE